jgi:hypothetical protein
LYNEERDWRVDERLKKLNTIVLLLLAQVYRFVQPTDSSALGLVAVRATVLGEAPGQSCLAVVCPDRGDAA